jgi:hypothetical protein
MADAKIRIKVGSIEIDYEGDETFLKGDLLKVVQDLQKIAPAAPATSGKSAIAESKSAAGAPSLTTKSIATTLGAKSGSDLAEAAVAHLAIIKGMTTFKRSEINDAMKSASGIYNANMTANLTKIIQTLLNQKTIVETASDTYSLTPDAETKLKGQLGIG